MEKSNRLAWLVLFVACIANFSPNYSQYQLSPLAPQLMESFGMNASQFSSIFTAVLIPSIFLSLISGILTDRFGLKRVIGIGLCITALGSCLKIFAGSYGQLLIFMLMTGIGPTLLNANSAKIIGSYFSKEKSVTMMSIFLVSATLAMTVGMGTTTFFPSISSAFTLAAIISIVGVAAWMLVVKNPETTPTASAHGPGILEGLKIVVKNKYVWLTGLGLIGVVGSATAINAFLPTALAERGIDSIQAGLISSFMPIGNIIGCLLIPVIANKLGKNKLIMAVCALIGALGAAFAWKAPEGAPLFASLLLTGASLSGLVPLLIPIPIHIKEIGAVYAGTAGGFVNTIELLGVVLVPSYIIAPIAGTNMDLYYLLCGLCAIAALIIVFFLPELGRKATQNM
ncbi:MAG: MFS transporter [Eubacterium sp.]|nr:MFS transporter [Eubacterium sp.]